MNKSYPKPSQEDIELKDGFCLNPFTPLWLGVEPSDENNSLAFHLYLDAKDIDREGNKADYLEDIDFFARKVQGDVFGWYKAALRAWKVKLFRGWERKYGSFKDFCEKALKKTSACINNWIRSARVLSQLISLGFCRLPSSAAVCLELSKLDTDSLGDVWSDITNDLEDHEITLEKVKNRLSDPFQEKPQLKQIRIDAEKWEQLREIAADAGLSPTKLLDQLIDGYLGANQNGDQDSDQDSDETDRDSDSNCSIPGGEPSDLERLPDNQDNDGDYNHQGKQIHEDITGGGNRTGEHLNNGIIPSPNETGGSNTDGNLYAMLPLQQESEHMPVVSPGLQRRKLYDGLLPLSGTYNPETGRFEFKHVGNSDRPNDTEQSTKRSPDNLFTNFRSDSRRGDAATGQNGSNARPDIGGGS
jgi:hypothetical protein